MNTKKKITKIVKVNWDLEINPETVKVPDLTLSIKPFLGGKALVNGKEGNEFKFEYNSRVLIQVELDEYHTLIGFSVNGKFFKGSSLLFNIRHFCEVTVITEEVLTYNLNLTSNIGVITVNKKFYSSPFNKRYKAGTEIELEAFDTDYFKFDSYDYLNKNYTDRKILIKGIDKDISYRYNYNMLKPVRKIQIHTTNIKSFSIRENMTDTKKYYPLEGGTRTFNNVSNNIALQLVSVERESEDYTEPVIQINGEIILIDSLPYSFPNNVDSYCSIDSVQVTKYDTEDLKEYAKKKIVNYATIEYMTTGTVRELNSGIRPSTMLDAFNGMENLKFMPGFRGLDTFKCTSMQRTFAHLKNAEIIDVRCLMTNKVETFNSMFYECSKVKYLDLSSFRTNSANDYSFMFYRCSSLEILDLSYFTFNKDCIINNMFGGTYSLQYLILPTSILRANNIDPSITKNTTIIVPKESFYDFRNSNIFSRYIKQIYSNELFDIVRDSNGIKVTKRGE